MWPTPQQYNLEIQNPRTCFRDPDLKSGEVDRLPGTGLPRPRSGQFATVYKIRSGARQWAVRCFTRQVDDQTVRYAAISEMLRQTASPYTVPFQYLREGILVEKTWFPILKMQWVEGEPLDVYISKLLRTPDRILDFARQWIAMLKWMEQVGIAHGDLQHGNVLVSNGDLKLVDYDGMYVPKLTGLRSNELGHRNYQHPKRTPLDFGKTLDSFSGWVVYVSLIALSIEPDLWQRFRGGDECLIFRQADFNDPGTSPLFQHLEKHPEASLAQLGQVLHRLLLEPMSAIPILDGGTIVLPNMHAGSVAPTGNSWWSDHVPKRQPATSAGVTIPAAATGEDSSWIFDFLKPETPQEIPTFTGNHIAERITLLASVLIILMGPTPTSFGTGLLTLILIGGSTSMLGLVWFRGYQIQGPTKLATSSRRVRSLLQQGVDRANLKLKNAQSQNLRPKKTYDDFDANTASAIQKLAAKELAESNQVGGRFTPMLAELARNRQLVAKRETDAMATLRNGLGQQVAILQQQITASHINEANELNARLATLQEEHVRSSLSRIRLEYEAIRGIGTGIKTALRLVGVNSAADINYWLVQRANGVGRERAAELIRWRDAHAAKARTGGPKRLTQTDVTLITTRHQGERRLWESQLANLDRQRNAREIEIRNRATVELQPIERAELDLSNAWKAEEGALTTHYAAVRTSMARESSQRKGALKADIEQTQRMVEQSERELMSAKWKLGKADREADRFANITFARYVSQVLMLRRAA
jgi:hypothetical protein